MAEFESEKRRCNVMVPLCSETFSLAVAEYLTLDDYIGKIYCPMNNISISLITLTSICKHHLKNIVGRKVMYNYYMVQSRERSISIINPTKDQNVLRSKNIIEY